MSEQDKYAATSNRELREIAADRDRLRVENEALRAAGEAVASVFKCEDKIRFLARDQLPITNGWVDLYLRPPPSPDHMVVMRLALDKLELIELRPWHSQVRFIAAEAIAALEAIPGVKV